MKQGTPFDIRKAEPLGGWLEVAPGLSFGVRAIPNRWYRFWLAVLCGWTFYRQRPE